MTTPHQGPQGPGQGSGMWQQGDQDAAVRWLASLDQADQVALRRSMQTQRSLAPIYNAVNRSIEFTREKGRSLNEGAQSLVSQTKQHGRDALAWAGRTGADLVDRADDLRDRAGVKAEVAGTRLSDGLDRTGRAISSGAAATRDAVASGAGAIRTTAVSATQGIAATAGRVSRWFKEKVSNTTGRAAAGFHAMKEFSAPDLNAQSAPAPGGPQLSATAITGVASQVHAFATAESATDRQAALNSLVGSMDKDNQAMLMAALINSGQAPAAGAVNAAQQAPDGRGTQNQPGKGPELGK